jgi:endo-1,4-beta-xylanase
VEKKFLALLAGFFFISSCYWGEKVQLSKRENIRDEQKVNLIIAGEIINKSPRKMEGLEIQWLEDSSGLKEICRVRNEKQPKFIHSYTYPLPLSEEKFSSGEKLLLQFRAKTLKAAYSESGEAKLKFIFGISRNRKKWIHKIMSISSEWKTYYFPVEIKENLPSKALKINLQLGFPPQEFLISDLQLFKYDRSIKMEMLPKTKVTYSGMEKEASWRKEAEKRIENYRKGDIELVVRKDGKTMSAAPIEIELKKHHFRWGVTIKAKNLVDDPAYMTHIESYFNQVTFGNDLKIKHWKRWKSYTEKAFDLLEAAQIPVKGHVLIWPGFRHLTPFFEENREDPLALERKMKEHLDEILTFTRGRVDRWDVTNETYTNNDLQNILGSEEILYEGFRELKSRQPDVLRFTNEYGIISRGGIYKEKQDWYKDYVHRVDENTGGAVDGIGIQCHMGTAPTGMEKVYQILEDFAELGKMIGVSEFTMSLDDPEIRYRYTKDFMTLAFSHPAVHEFVFWGMNEKDNWKVDLFAENWELGSMGKAFSELLHNKWTTTVKGRLNESGTFTTRGFYGVYVYKVYLKGDIYNGEFQIAPGSSNKMEINL